MKLMFISLLFLPIILMADGPMGENVKGYYGGEEIFTDKGQFPMPPKGYDRGKCMQANARFRTLINRIRTITFRVERKCSKGSGNAHKSECSGHVAHLEEIYGIFNRQFEVMSKVCLAE